MLSAHPRQNRALHAALRRCLKECDARAGGRHDPTWLSGAQITEILAEAQQSVPEQLRQYAQVAGGGGGGARTERPFPTLVMAGVHTLCIWLH